MVVQNTNSVVSRAPVPINQVVSAFLDVSLNNALRIVHLNIGAAIPFHASDTTTWFSAVLVVCMYLLESVHGSRVVLNR